jgi:hypothetical protein
MTAPTYNEVTVTGQVIYNNGVGDPVSVSLSPLGTYFDNANGVAVNPQAQSVNANTDGTFSLSNIIDPTNGDGLAWNLVVKDGSSILYSQKVQIAYSNGASQNWLLLGVAQINPTVIAYLPLSGGTLTGRFVTAGVTLTDAATVAVDASTGNDFILTLGGNRTIGAPANPAANQRIIFELIQDATGSRTVTWNSVYSFGSGTAPVLSTTAGAVDQVGFRYSATKSKWLYLGSAGGF